MKRTSERRNMITQKKDWILLVLNQAPLDRIHLIKVLFLLWYRSKKKINDYFKFVPSYDGPTCLEIYPILGNLKIEGLISAPCPSESQWANYYLTKIGKEEAKKIEKKVSINQRNFIKKIAQEVFHITPKEVVQKICAEAPEFAINFLRKNL